ncbi:DUF4279 domain-containing protein [Sphingobacterium sp. BIGb0165]|uniref:DUF4279 domain-containing protein n=1 Tax=Sphingobacterium sp. BIGb0165 TaxID=2940615 RepID=UPI002168A3B9|nr:DUF4279 domain-containing protein [Sphingobacterium sp. BIGb0165]MCS4228856.1 hypothetical protein [Sphingobacterium sp. BIGb0165]
MTTTEIIELIEFELKFKEWGITEQFLEIHAPALFENKIQIGNIVINQSGISVYIPIENERFYLVMYIDSNKKEIIRISIEPHITIYFKATSAELSETELRNYTNLEITESWNKGDKKASRKSTYNFSGIIIEPSKKPNDFASKLDELISELKKDKVGVRKLSKIADGYIQVDMDSHYGNGMIGGPNLNEVNIRELNNLGLSIDFYFCVSGSPYKS